MISSDFYKDVPCLIDSCEFKVETFAEVYHHMNIVHSGKPVILRSKLV